MDYSRLIIALLLPWLAGYLWLAALENLFNPDRANRYRQAGYGLFLGYAVTQGVVLACSSLMGNVTFAPVIATLTIITLAGGVSFIKTRPSVSLPASPHAEQHVDTPWTTALVWIFAAWAVLHLTFAAIEILHVPVYPWDAWLSWLYRAKAWFYSGHVFVLDHPSDWLQGGGNAAYNTTANHYPTFMPVLALWAATALGAWSETLVNLPTLFGGIALGLALYGQSREQGMARWQSALAAYLLLSIPLVGAHLSLAGYADIWMSGFTGLGFVALLAGLTRPNRWQLILGFGMTAMGIATKAEGAVWLLAFMMALALVVRIRLCLATLAVAACLLGVAWLAGVSYFDLPLLGGAGVAEGRLFIPLLGSYALQSFDLWDDYWSNFIVGGSWHLLWVLVLLTVIVLWRLPAGRLRLTLVAFFAVLITTQLFIFLATEMGIWAEQWTAINRLALHFTPALIFALAIALKALLSPDQANMAPIRSASLAALALVLTLAGAIAYLSYDNPAGDAKPRTFPAGSMQIVVGGGQVGEQAAVVKNFRNNIAVVTSGTVQLNAEQFGLAKIETAGPNQEDASFFWRNGTGPDDLHSVKIAGRGTQWLNLNKLPGWQGKVSEIGLIFYAYQGEPVEYRQINITPHSLQTHLSRLMQAWSEPTYWTQFSVNYLTAGAVNSPIPLPLLMSAWLLVAIALAFAINIVIADQSRRFGAGTLVLCALLAWGVLDLRWTANQLAQARSTLATYPLVSATQHGRGGDKATRQLVDKARAEIEEAGTRTIIMVDDSRMYYQVQRARYHALPAATYAHEGSPEDVPTQIGQYLLMLKTAYPEPGRPAATAADYAEVLSQRTAAPVTTLWETSDGFLLKLSAMPAEKN